MVVAMAVRRQEGPALVGFLPGVHEKDDPDQVDQHAAESQEDEGPAVLHLGRHEQFRDRRKKDLPRKGTERKEKERK